MSRASAGRHRLQTRRCQPCQVRDLDTELERDDGKVYYEIDFEVGDTEYSMTLKPTGRILDYDIDYDDDDDDDRPRTTTKSRHHKYQTTTKLRNDQGPDNDEGPSAELIGRTRAENIAFQHAGVTRSQVRDLETNLDSDDGRILGKFEVGDTEYEYDIEAYTGRILDYEIDLRRLNSPIENRR